MTPLLAPGVLASLFVLGLLSTLHCLGMCGGIVTALTVRTPAGNSTASFQLAYHIGRLATYALAGALAGGVGSAAMIFSDFLPVQMALYVAAQIMLIALGCYLIGITRFLQPLERGGALLWRKLQPLAGRLLPVRSVPRAFTVGLLWGFLPCGLVYSVLATALVSGSPLNGALALISFGGGTLPGLLAGGVLLPLLQRLRCADAVRRTAGGIVVIFGLLGLGHAAQLQHLPGDALFCAIGQH